MCQRCAPLDRETALHNVEQGPMELELTDQARDGQRNRVRLERFPGGGPDATRRALATAAEARAVVLVEGISDQIALETLAARRGRDLAAEGVAVVPIGGAQAVQGFLARFGSPGSNAKL